MKSKIKNIIIIIIFALIIFIPILKLNFLPNIISEVENRELANFPVIFDENGKLNEGIKKSFENWYNDNIGFRDEMVSIASRVKFNIFGIRFNEKVEEGKDGWYFYKNDNNVEIAKGKYKIDSDFLESMARKQMRIKNKLAEQGIDYALILPPSKVSIYPEEIAEADVGVIETPVDIIADYLEKNTDIKVIRLKQELLEAKKEKQVYFKTDTHWNETGAYVAYGKIINDLNKFGIIHSEPVDVDFVECEYTGEFAAMYGNVDILPAEKTLTSEINDPKAVELTEGQRYEEIGSIKNGLGEFYPHRVFMNESAEDKKALVFGDSMFGLWNMTELLSENFSELTYIWSRNIDQAYIDCVKPDVVLYEVTERYLNTLTDNSPGFRINVLTDPEAEVISTNAPTELKRGGIYDIDVVVKNRGDESWYEDDMVRLCVWQDGTDLGCRVNLPQGAEVKPGEEYTFTFEDFTAPSKKGSYIEFQMVQEGINYFGEKERVDIK